MPASADLSLHSVPGDRREGRVEQRTAPAPAERYALEAEILHQVLFGGAAPVEVKSQYARLWSERPVAGPVLEIAALWQQGIDLEALELALRRRDPANGLSQRIHSLCYLVEVRPEYHDSFVNERPRPLSALAVLGLHVVRSAVKLAKGRRLERALGLR